MIESKKETALQYARRGWPVIPLHTPTGKGCSCSHGQECNHPGKHPRTEHGLKDATTDEKIIHNWWDKWPDANIGIITGVQSGIIVIDVDGEEGEQALHALVQEHGCLPNTVEQITGSGGRHILFKHPGIKVKNKVRFADGLDCRGDGGYIVAPPSLHHSGKRYEWEVSHHPEETDMADPPQWLLDRINGNTSGMHSTLPSADSEIPEGKRNTTLTSMAGIMRRNGMSVEAIFAALSEENSTKCKPPLDEKEIHTIAESIGNYTPVELLKEKKSNIAEMLLVLAKDAELFHSPDGQYFATIEVNGHKENWPINSSGFRNWLVHKYYRQEERAPYSEALQSALKTLEAKAQFEGSRHEVFLRVAGHDGNIYIDPCTDRWEVFEVTSDGFNVISKSPVKFRRAKGMEALPYPVFGNAFDIRHFFNVKSEDNLLLIISWMIAALRPTGSYPLLVLLGEQGSAKSTTARMIRDLIDPSTLSLRSLPRNEEDLMIAANSGWGLSFDNLSRIPVWLSDSLCRLSTGGGIGTRKFYTNNEEVLFAAMRPVILNGITEVVTRPDLLERSLVVTLNAIPEIDRKDEKTLWWEFEQQKASLLGGLLNALSSALHNIDNIRLQRYPRMADYAKWVTASEPGLGLHYGTFMNAYDRNHTEAIELNLEADPVATVLRSFVDSQRDYEEWEGTSTELLEKLERLDSMSDQVKRPKEWPQNARSLSCHLKRSATFLRQVGIDVCHREGGRYKRNWIIRKCEKFCATCAPQVTHNTQLPEKSGDNNVAQTVTQIQNNQFAPPLDPVCATYDKSNDKSELQPVGSANDKGSAKIPTISECNSGEEVF